MTADALTGGFADAPVDAAHAFRAALAALAHPGRPVALAGAVPPAPLSVAAGVLLLTLADGTTPVHLAGAADCASLRAWITFHTGAPLVAPGDAVFALGDWASLDPVQRFSVGTPANPDRAATLIVEVAELAPANAVLTGPGILGEARLRLPGIAAFQANRALFPLGVDVFLTCGNRVAGIPRSTRVEAL